MNHPLRSWLSFGGLSVLACTPTILMEAYYLNYRWTRPPTFPGDPDIGFGLLMLVAFTNVPVLALTWIGWFAWRMLSARKNTAVQV